MKKWFVLPALLVSVSAAGMADAQVYNFSFTGMDVSGSGRIFTQDASNGSPILSITGTVYDSEVGAGPFTITTLSPYADADNLYYTTPPFADYGGISFNTDKGGAFNIGGGGTTPGGLVLNSAVLDPDGSPLAPGSVNITASSSAVPEPATWAMMLVGFGMVGFGLRYRRKSTAVRFA